MRAIADGAFANSKIKSIEIPYKVATIGKEAFKGSKLESIVVYGSALKEIGESAFEKTALKSVVLPESVLEIGKNAFNGSALEEITFGARVVEVGEGAFWNCASLKAINVSEKNMKFSSIAGNLYNKDGSKLYYYAAGKDASSFFASDVLVAIEKDAFLGAKLKNIVLPFLGANVDEPAAIGYLIGGKVPETLKEVTVTGGVIVDGAFEGCENLSKVSLVGSVSSVGEDAFKDCLGLMYVEYGDYITEVKADAFYMCHRLVEVKLGKSVKTIGARAFENCADLKTIVFSEKLEKIGNSAFSNCDSLTNVVIPDKVEKIGNSAFFDCDGLKSIAIGNSVASIGEFAFRSCGNLENISVNQNNEKYKSIEGNLYTKDGTTLVQYAVGKADPYFNVPNEVVEISAGAFEDGGDGLIGVTIGAGVKVIGEAAFAYCWNITNINVSEDNENYMSVDGNLYTKDGKTLIRYGVGKDESSFEVPSTVETIVEGAFFGEDDLVTLTVYFVGESVSTEKNGYLGHLFGARAYNDNATFVPESLKNVIVKECDAIGFGAFYGCNLEELTVPFVGNELNGVKNTHFGYIFGATSEENNATYVPETLKKVVVTDATVIANNAFKGCKYIEEIVLPVGVVSIGGNAFEACTSLTKINLPATLEEIGTYAFWNCESLEVVSIPSKIEAIKPGTFRACKSLKTLVIGNSVKEIGSCAFEGCAALNRVEIPASVKTIMDNAFWNTGLTSVTFATTNGWTAAGEAVDVSNAATAATLLTVDYVSAMWQR